jgi:hypothetical protein
LQNWHHRHYFHCHPCRKLTLLHPHPLLANILNRQPQKKFFASIVTARQLMALNAKVFAWLIAIIN